MKEGRQYLLDAKTLLEGAEDRIAEAMTRAGGIGALALNNLLKEVSAMQTWLDMIIKEHYGHDA